MEYGAVVAWWLLSVALAVAGLPVAATLFRRLPDRGAGVALPLALLVLALPAYWVGHVAFGPPAVAAGVLALGALSLATAWRGSAVDRQRFVEWGVVFTLAFGLLVAVRAVDPSVVPVHPGERLLDYGLLNTHVRADQLPAEDMWFAGEPVRYYYGGHMLSSVLATLAAVPARYAFNLAVAGFYATLVAGAYGIAGGIAASRGVSFRQGGALGAFFVGIASNLAPVVEAVLVALPDALAEPVADGLASVTALSGSWLLGRIGRAPGEYWSYYWAPSRVIRGTINEFPLFAWLNGDLHAHMMSQPFLLLAIGIGFAYFRTPADRRRRRRLLLFGAAPAVAGWIAVTNTWSFPTVAGIVGVAALLAPADPRDLLPTSLLDASGGPRDELGRIAGAAFAGVVVALLGAVWVLPYFLVPETPGGVSDGFVGLVSDRSGLIEFLLVHGWFLAVFAAYLWGRIAPRIERPRRTLALGAMVVLAGVLAGGAAFGLVLPLAVAAWYLLRTDGDVGFEAVLFVAGGGLVLLVELVYLEEAASPGRFNTVFKAYSQLWVIWAIGAGAALAHCLPSAFPTRASDRRTRVSVALAALLVASTSIYGAVALGAHFTDTERATLDATAEIRESHPAVWEGIRFLARQDGRPDIVSAPGSPYRWQAAPSSFTGIPTVVTGLHHERSFHGREAVQQRVADVRVIYTGSAAERARLLRAYDVEYVWVGPWVRQRYGSSSLTVAESPGLVEVFRNERVTIYRTSVGRGETVRLE